MRVELEMNVPNLGSKLRQARKKARLTQRTVARKSGVTDKTINHIETNLRGIKYSLFCRLCDLYGVSPGELLNIPMLDESELSEVLS